MDQTRLNKLLDKWHEGNPYEDSGLSRLSEILEICYERARVTGYRQRLMWNRQHKSWEVVSLSQQPLPALGGAP